MTDYKATPEQWENCKHLSDAGAIANTCILELRARVEALEANHPEKPDSSDPAGSLVERLVKAVYGPSNTQEGWRSEARAAIREVAAWIEETQHDHWSAVSRILRFELDYPTPNPPPSKP